MNFKAKDKEGGKGRSKKIDYFQLFYFEHAATLIVHFSVIAKNEHRNFCHK